MSRSLKRVAVTGGAGQIAYSLLFRIAHGDLLGKDQPIALHILELPESLQALKGVQMELEDCAFPLLQEIRIGTDPREIFQDIDYALLVGAKPRGPGMERSDLLQDNGKIFVAQGRALNEVARQDVKVLVVGNPCNTNCLIAMHSAPRIPKQNFHAMTRLDQNRAQNLLAAKAKVSIEEVTRMTIWGNHSATQVPDFFNAKIQKIPAIEKIHDQKWLEGEFVSAVQKRGATIIAARGKSSAASAANAAIDAIRSILHPTPKDNWFSSAIYTQGNPYGIPEDLVFSFPCRSQGKGDCEIIPHIPWNDFLKKSIAITVKELQEEKEFVKELLNNG